MTLYMNFVNMKKKGNDSVPSYTAMQTMLFLCNVQI